MFLFSTSTHMEDELFNIGTVSGIFSMILSSLDSVPVKDCI